ncbi:uncharacterized protein SPAPADRAFT_61273 [Spathaspora passalidarum NRRL Y-27907]|uniref:Smr domain-containing protein n=1 Tax=Spathaspora passalidarum (strain NRRL Y-27907 / 11-Y1) TaxID=619300 RepID=G3APL8_SPAPN|nr:uncharacterized protein SPAPADRAFT_61273 [Spathaspora passalidarum NRRL Y-27907]EGW32189.1 hypothetical protein SPAPADRAFT_61273 [Spathaspora passalidarum NRRL Y-27907]
MNCRPMVNKKVYPRGGGGRVQRGGGEKRNKPRAVITRVKSTYKYNPQSDEAKEFWTLYDSNPQFHNIDRQILINALEFFEGEVYKAVALATELISHPQYNRKPKITSSARHQRQSNDPYLAVSQKFTNYQRVKAEATTSEKDQFRKYLESSVVDLHMLRLTQAMTLTKMVLNHWWEEEMRYREQDGNLGRFGHLAGTGAVTLITGRGIHSVGGVSVIRRFVKQYLTKNDYVFEEHSGKFEVKGKRGTHR